VHAYPLECEDLVDDVLDDLDRLTEEVRAGFEGLSPDALAWKPAPDSWSVGECLVHLARINGLYRERLEQALAKARRRGTKATRPLRGRWFGRWFTRAVGPMGRSVRTPPIFRPRREVVEAGAMRAFLDEQDALRELVISARGLDLDAVRVVSPASPLFRFRASDALRILVEHEKRHLAQADRVVASPGFPTVAA